MTKIEYNWNQPVTKKDIAYMEKREKAFDSLTRGMDNWKMPIKAKIEESMFSLFNEACVHYTGSTLTISKRYADGKVDVVADGYYNAVGA